MWVFFSLSNPFGPGYIVFLLADVAQTGKLGDDGEPSHDDSLRPRPAPRRSRKRRRPVRVGAELLYPGADLLEVAAFGLFVC